jgi:hypothetical protein
MKRAAFRVRRYLTNLIQWFMISKTLRYRAASYIVILLLLTIIMIIKNDLDEVLPDVTVASTTFPLGCIRFSP